MAEIGTVPILIGCGIALLLFWNLLTYQVFASDKRAAILRDSRVPEATLLFMAATGGWFGAKLAQHRLRHKTRKEPFRTVLNGIGIVEIGIVLVLLVPEARAVVGDAVLSGLSER